MSDRADRLAAKDPLAAAIDRCRVQRGWSVADLAAAAGVHVSTCRYLLRGVGVNLHTLRSVAAALGLEVRLAPNPVERRRAQWREYKRRLRNRPQPSTEGCGQPGSPTDTGRTVQIGRSVLPDSSGDLNAAGGLGRAEAAA